MLVAVGISVVFPLALGSGSDILAGGITTVIFLVVAMLGLRILYGK